MPSAEQVQKRITVFDEDRGEPFRCVGSGKVTGVRAIPAPEPWTNKTAGKIVEPEGLHK